MMMGPRTEMKCRLCQAFSSASTCARCESSPAFFYLCAAELKIAALTDSLERVAKQRDEAKRDRKNLVAALGELCRQRETK